MVRFIVSWCAVLRLWAWNGRSSRDENPQRPGDWLKVNQFFLERIQGGRVLNYEGKPERQMCRLYLSMMDKMNVRLPKFGDATKALEEV